MPVLSNSRHERFAQELAKGKTADEAYVLAGFKENRGNATRLKANERVRKRVDEILGEAAEKTGISVQWVLDGLVQNYNRAMQAEALRDADGKPTGEFKYDGSVANKSLELIGKHLKMFTDKVEHAGTVPVTFVIEG